MFDSPGQVFRVPAKTTDTGPATKSQKIEIVAAWFETHGTRRFGPLLDVEKMQLAALAKTPTKGTLFEYFGPALWEGGVKAPEMPTMDRIMSEFELSQDNIDKVGCYCVHQTGVALGSHVAYMLRSVAGLNTV